MCSSRPEAKVEKNGMRFLSTRPTSMAKLCIRLFSAALSGRTLSTLMLLMSGSAAASENADRSTLSRTAYMLK